MGFSAGGQLSAVTSLADAATEAKPDFTGLVYAARLEESADFAATVPPAFLAHAADDGVPCLSSLAYAAACYKAKVPVELHLFPKGGHGYGLRSKEAGLKEWPNLFVQWIRRLA
jgi:acetyl esterase/lipase